ncbi:MAG: Cof-type HAD-IIB family hydrolase [Longicatena sp.]
MKKIKAIMCDVDGTLLTTEQVVSKKTIQAIKDVRNQGILFGLCSGRDVLGIKKRLKDWGIEGCVDVIVGSGGSELYDTKTNTKKETFPLDGELIKMIMKHYEDMDVNFAIPLEGVLYAPKDDELIRMLSEGDKEPYFVVDYDEMLKKPQLKVMIVCKESYMDQVVERSKTFHNEHFKASALITASVLFEYMDPRISKSSGMKELLQTHNITLDEVCSFGDADNDYDMTLHSGVGVVMANGSEKTKSVADYITNDNDHDGIANFIYSHILN